MTKGKVLTIRKREMLTWEEALQGFIFWKHRYSPATLAKETREKEEPERLDSGFEGTELIPDLLILH